MGIVKRADVEVGSDAIAIDLSDIAGQAAALKARAREESERILEEARAERARILEGADEQGFAEGHERGHAAGYEAGLAEGRERAHAERREAFDQFSAAWSSVLAAFSEARSELLEGARADLVRLAAVFAERVTKRAVELDESAVLAQLESLVGMVGSATRLVIRVGPEDEPIVREALPEIVGLLEGSPHTELVVDGALPRGSCELTTGDGTRYDGRVDSQIERLVRAMLPGGGTRELSDEAADEPPLAPESDDRGEDDGEQRIGDLAA